VVPTIEYLALMRVKDAYPRAASPTASNACCSTRLLIELRNATPRRAANDMAQAEAKLLVG